MLALESAVRIQALLEEEAQELRHTARLLALHQNPSPSLLEHLYEQAEQCQCAAEEMGPAVAASATAERPLLRIVCSCCRSVVRDGEGDTSHTICLTCKAGVDEEEWAHA